MSGPPFVAGEPVAVAIATGVGAALVGDTHQVVLDEAEVFAEIERIERTVGPRWVWWSKATATTFVEAGIRPARCWDLGAVHRLLHGGWRTGADRTWAATHGLDPRDTPRAAPPDLFSAPHDGDDPDTPLDADGHLRPAWVDDGWRSSLDHVRTWAALALEAFHEQQRQIDGLPDRPAAPATARSESAAELLCAELEADGLPVDLAEAEAIIATFIGPRPRDASEERRLAAERDDRVLAHLDPGLADGIDLRNPAGVKSLLRRAGIEVADTRAWRLEQLRHEHAIVDALLTWRKAERICTTFGYRWLDAHVGPDGRLRGSWTGSDGAAGRMTATAGLHNMPADLRPAIIADAGHVFVRADLGQIEPRVLAAVSGDDALAVATFDDDMYAPVARRLDVPRETAKVAVLGAMYGQTTGHGAAALRGLERAYPVAMRFLDDAARAAEGGTDLRTRGGRLVRMTADGDDSGTDGRDDAAESAQRSRAAARGRYGRNAMIQGAAAEFFKTWAVIVRARTAAFGATIVLCLHDELVVHTPLDRAAATADAVDDALQEAAHRWLGAVDGPGVRFVTETTTVRRWSDAK